MAQVVIKVNGRDYKVTCENGQEDRLKKLAGYFDGEVNELASELGQIGDARLMLLSALTVCDDLFEAKVRISELETVGDTLEPETIGAAGRAIDAAAERVREMASRIDAA